VNGEEVCDTSQCDGGAGRPEDEDGYRPIGEETDRDRGIDVASLPPHGTPGRRLHPSNGTGRLPAEPCKRPGEKERHGV
jgi:hypothetical protein